jgi:hypothetical protein
MEPTRGLATEDTEEHRARERGTEIWVTVRVAHFVTWPLGPLSKVLLLLASVFIRAASVADSV